MENNSQKSNSFSFNQIKTNPSGKALLFSNLITIVLAVTQQWSFAQVVWIYWAQSVIIGIFQFLKILDLKEFDTTGFKINGQHAQPTNAIKYFTAFFFLFHYGFFHFIYLVFLGVLFGNREISFISIASVSVLFSANHLYSFLHNRRADRERKSNIGVMMFQPYARIIPMHLTIVFGGVFVSMTDSAFARQALLVFFLLLKSIADLFSHTIEHTPPKS